MGSKLAQALPQWDTFSLFYWALNKPALCSGDRHCCCLLRLFILQTSLKSWPWTKSRTKAVRASVGTMTCGHGALGELSPHQSTMKCVSAVQPSSIPASSILIIVLWDGRGKKTSLCCLYNQGAWGNKRLSICSSHQSTWWINTEKSRLQATGKMISNVTQASFIPTAFYKLEHPGAHSSHWL